MLRIAYRVCQYANIPNEIVSICLQLQANSQDMLTIRLREQLHMLTIPSELLAYANMLTIRFELAAYANNSLGVVSIRMLTIRLA